MFTSPLFASASILCSLLVAINSLHGGWIGTERKRDRGSHAEDEPLLQVKSHIHKARGRGRIPGYTQKLDLCKQEGKNIFDSAWCAERVWKTCIILIDFWSSTMHYNFKSLLDYLLRHGERGFSSRRGGYGKQGGSIATAGSLQFKRSGTLSGTDTCRDKSGTEVFPDPPSPPSLPLLPPFPSSPPSHSYIPLFNHQMRPKSRMRLPFGPVTLLSFLTPYM